MARVWFKHLTTELKMGKCFESSKSLCVTYSGFAFTSYAMTLLDALDETQKGVLEQFQVDASFVKALFNINILVNHADGRFGKIS